jgi:SAM-dependent methyltransferase
MSRKKKQSQEKAPVDGAVEEEHSLPWLFAGTLFLSATLLFMVEPMMAKMILPLLGGTASVWTTCMVFYQAVLLAGYLYAHVSSARLSLRHQLLLHMALVFVPIVALPLGITEDWVPPTEDNPVGWLLLLLLVSVGLPFFILSSNTPLLQKWFASTGHREARDPYFLYAASNLGSLFGLNGYLLLIEPNLTLNPQKWLSQSWLWTVSYGLLIVLIVGCVWVVGKLLDREPESKPSAGGQPSRSLATVPAGAKPAHRPAAAAVAEERQTIGASPPGVLTRLRWVALAFVPSSLMLGATTYITLDIAAIPLFWVIPLDLYLISFILVFAKWPERLHNALILVLPAVLIVLILLMHGALPPRIDVLITAHLLALFLVALVCHGELALSRPPARYLTEFYLWLSVGGVLGGLFNALLAPAIFPGVAEYQIGLVLACLLIPSRHPGKPWWITRWLPQKLVKPASLAVDVGLALLVGFFSYRLLQLFALTQVDHAWLGHLRDEFKTKYFVALGKFLGVRPVEAGAILLFGLPLLLCYALAARPLQFLLAALRSLRQALRDRMHAVRAGPAYEYGHSEHAREPLVNYLFVRRPLLFGLGVGAFMLNYYFWHHVTSSEPAIYQARNFYGVLKVSSAPEAGQPQLRLTNGTTSHGAQWYHREPEVIARYLAPAVACVPSVALDTALRLLIWSETDREPLSYYHRTGPIGQVFAEFSGPKAKKDVAVIGLGTGTLASYGEPGQNFLFFDIDPAVLEIAGTFFTYLTNCRAKWDVVLGDARLRMKLAEDKQFQLIIVDAFNSDAIPVHLLTREAIELYFQKLSDDGIVALHISNRYLDLQPVLGNLAERLRLAGLFQADFDLRDKPGKRASHWVLLAHRREDFGNLIHDPRWRPIESRPEVGVWTDDYSNLLGVFKWH